MHCFSGLLCVVLIVLSPVRALAINWEYWKRLAVNGGCEVAVTMALKWIHEAAEIIGVIGKQPGCEWLGRQNSWA
jgi:hypothetical protein